MLIRRAVARDRPAVRRLAERLNLDYPGMDADPFWVVEEDGVIVAVCGLKTHPDGREVCAVGVAESFRGRGAAKAVVGRALEETPGDVYLATVRTEVFASLGFVPADPVPASLAARPDGWCEGCSRERCRVLVRRGG
ncbi:MAG: GNAT family N-acetyltransferase [Candidatus Aminicenantes bacterium]|nr:GNAT family N-acetyltransferase [Candidatus Aminicenantes bacterium]